MGFAWLNVWTLSSIHRPYWYRSVITPGDAKTRPATFSAIFAAKGFLRYADMWVCFWYVGS